MTISKCNKTGIRGLLEAKYNESLTTERVDQSVNSPDAFRLV